MIFTHTSLSIPYPSLFLCLRPTVQTMTLSYPLLQIMPPAAAAAGKTNMRSRQRPVSQNGPSPHTLSAPMRPTRKLFNCIVDDSALVAGVKKSTRNGIRQWVKNGQIRLFVPLHGT